MRVIAGKVLMDRHAPDGLRDDVVQAEAECRELIARWHGRERLAYAVTLDTTALGACNKVLATGTLLINDTLDAVLAHARGAQRVAMVGPTVGGLPDALFARGVHVLGGTWVTDPSAFTQALVTGAERGEAARKFTLERSAWPGWPALLARLARLKRL